MKTYKCQAGKPTLTEWAPDGWVDVDAPTMIEAAGVHMRAIKPRVSDYPLMVYVSDGKLLHPNGAPMCVHGYLFQLDIVENNPTADEVGTRLTQERHAAGLGVWATPQAFTEAISKALWQKGIPHSLAKYDEVGVCLTCGEELPRCPGVHTFEEIQEKARAAKGGTSHAL